MIIRLLATSALAGGTAHATEAVSDTFIVSDRRPAQPVALVGQTTRVIEARPFATVVASLAPETLTTGGPPALREGPAPTIAGTEEETEVLFEADIVTRETETSPIIAEGNVRAYFGARYMRADRLSYNPQTDIVIAEGNVSITDENLETAFAGRVELTGDLRDGVAENFSALLAENARMAADSAVREQGARTRLSRAVYTACEVCDEDGDSRVPTWRIRALRVTRDEERKVVRFYHAFFEIKGVPILYAPFLQGPDPSVERQSGFLTPVIGASSRLGFNFELPYYLAISNHQDATFYPKYTSDDGMLWQGEYRKRDVSGYHVWQGGVINFDNTGVDEDGRPFVDTPGVRWHFFGRGHRDFGDKWTAGYDVERVSDDTYLRRYDVERRGDLRQEIVTSSTNRLRSNAYVRWQDGGSEFTANTYLFQGLRSRDDSSLTPYVLPLLNFRHDFRQEIAGGRAYVNANFASLQRASGVDDQRFTSSAYWEGEHFTDNGHRFAAFGEMRGDIYYFHDLDEGTETLPGVPGEDNEVVARIAPTAGVEWSYPLTRSFGAGRLFVEPRVQLVASPANRNPASIINEDSRSTEFDYAGLFEYNKSTGYDAFEDGQRANIGVNASAVFDSGLSIGGSVGGQFRLQNTNAFDSSTGLSEKRSDIVGAVNVRYKSIIGVDNTFRIDDDNGSLQRVESTGFLNLWRFRGAVSYVRLNEENTRDDLIRREELLGTLRVKLTRHWSTGTRWRENLLAGRTITRDYIIGYADECMTLDLTYREDFTRDVGLTPDNALLITFTLRSLVD